MPTTPLTGEDVIALTDACHALRRHLGWAADVDGLSFPGLVVVAAVTLRGRARLHRYAHADVLAWHADPETHPLPPF